MRETFYEYVSQTQLKKKIINQMAAWPLHEVHQKQMLHGSLILPGANFGPFLTSVHLLASDHGVKVTQNRNLNAITTKSHP